MANEHARLINRLLMPAGVLLIAGTVFGVGGYVLMPDANTLSLPSATLASVGMVCALASGVEAVRALLAYWRWLSGRGEACRECGAPVVAPCLALFPFRCIQNRRHALDD